MTRTRPARSSVRHGTPTCGIYGCPQPECQRARRIYQARREHARLHGLPGIIDAAPVTQHIHRLTQAGMSHRDIAHYSGISVTTIHRYAHRRRTRTQRATADAILGIAIPAHTLTPVQPGHTDATQARNQLRALAALGYTLHPIARLVGKPEESLAAIRRGQRTSINIRLHQAINRTYRQLREDDPTDHGVITGYANQARRHAHQAGWPTPADLGNPAGKQNAA